MNFQAGAFREGRYLSNEECGGVAGAFWSLRLACREPGGECGVLDAALRCKDGRTERTGFKGGKNLLFVVPGVAGAASAVGFDDIGRSGLGDG